MNKQSIPLYRSRERVSTFLAALGEFRETRLTAALGYLIARAPAFFGPPFLSRGATALQVLIESFDQGNRFDVLIETRREFVLIEAKLGFRQSASQIWRYIRRLRRGCKGKRVRLWLLDRGSEPVAAEVRELLSRIPEKCEWRFLTWSELSRRLERTIQLRRLMTLDPEAVAIAQDLIATIRGSGMDATRVKEIYVRQLSGNSLELFFRHHVYTCQAKFGPNALQHQYFAPLFTARAPRDFATRSLLPIEKGLSHIARINEGRVLPRAAVLEYLQSVNHPTPKEAASLILRKDRGKEFTLLVLGPPIQLFPTPLSSGQLRVRGMLGQRTFTFEDLLLRSRVGA